MSEHESCIGESDEWYTPPEIFKALGLQFDLDPCGAPTDFVYASHGIGLPDDGLAADWYGLIWMNPPFGGRNGQVPWLQKFIKHGNGVALVAARTSAGWFHDLVPQCGAMCFPRGKTKFIRPDGSVGESPGTGIVLLSMGAQANTAVMGCGLGISVRLK